MANKTLTFNDLPQVVSELRDEVVGMKVALLDLQKGQTKQRMERVRRTMNVEEVVIPNQVIYKDKILKVTAIDTHAFYECSSLQSIIIPNSVTSIGERAFSGCTSLKSINMPNSVTSVGDNAFSKCSNLYSVTIGEGIELIGDYAFSYCGMLTEVYCLAKDVPRGDDGIFLNCFLDRATLHVPAGSIESYKKVSPWKKFKNIVALGSESSDNPTGEKCATPTIKYNKGKLVFNCSTEGSDWPLASSSPSC